MSDGTDREEDRILAGEFALGLLPQDEARAFAVRLEHEPELRALYAQWAEDFAAMTDTIPEETPPPSVQMAIEARLFPSPRKPGFFERFGLAGIAVAVLALLLFFSFDRFDIGPGAPTDPVYIADIAASDTSLLVEATYDADGTLYLQRSAGQARQGRVLELWLIAGDAPPVSLGVLPKAERTSLIVDETLRGLLNGGVLAISDEPLGGSPTGQPTGDVLATGAITNV